MATLGALNLGKAGPAASVLRPNLGPELVGQLQGGPAGALAAPPCAGAAIANLHDPTASPPAKNPTPLAALGAPHPAESSNPHPLFRKLIFVLLGRDRWKPQQKGMADKIFRSEDTHTDTHRHTHRHTYRH